MSGRIRVQIEGVVQGVGFRPFVYGLAQRLGVAGWVRNESGGVVIEAQGAPASLETLVERIRLRHPPLAAIHDLYVEELEPVPGESGFVIAESSAGISAVNVSPDCDVCPDCLREMFDPSDRRYRYPFINCTNCGPRYSIVRDVPYDRPFTTMASFPLCSECSSEYHDPSDRRFHAQPVACPACGPTLRLAAVDGTPVAGDAAKESARLLAEGRILAVKGVGGYHLAVDATSEEAVQELRRRKHRPDKPFGLMARDLDVIRRCCVVSDVEERLLTGPERPIVLLRTRVDAPVAPAVAPGVSYLGFMLPSTPLHHLLLERFDTPLVMTSGNRSGEPMAFQDDEAFERLREIADYVLFHDRDIHTRVDDSVLRVFAGDPLFFRRSRGFVPRPVRLPLEVPPVLALGGELKSCLCLADGSRAFMSHHIGDLTNPETVEALREGARHLGNLLRISPKVVAHDLHPDYFSTQVAEDFRALPLVPVQHHHAHMAACMAENLLEGDVIGVIFDGTGYGTDGTVWGGEFLTGGYDDFVRQGHLATVRLPGGDLAAREPFRMALSWLYRVHGEAVFDLPLPCLAEIAEFERPLYRAMLAKGINSPETSSCGRLFDAAAAILDVRRRISYEGQAAIELEGLAETGGGSDLLPWRVDETGETVVFDAAPMLAALAERVLRGESRALLARSLHRTVAAASAEICEIIRRKTGLSRAVLSGGVFQNRLLYDDLSAALRELGFDVFVHRLVSPNDSGLALGQAIVAGRRVRR